MIGVLAALTSTLTSTMATDSAESFPSPDVRVALSQGAGGAPHAVAPAPRPRLFLTAGGLQRIVEGLARPPRSAWWEEIRQRAEVYVREGLPSWAKGEEGASEHGALLSHLAFGFLVSRDPRFLEAARTWMNRAVALPTWGSDQDLGAAELLFGMAVAYDWLYEHLSERDRAGYRAEIARHARILHQLLVDRKKWWARDYLQNHNYVNAMSIAVAGVALHGEEDEATWWLEAARANFEEVARLLSPDGASHEGLGYWGCGISALLKYHFATREIFTDQNLLAGDYFGKASLFRLHASLPGFRENVNFADSPTLEWCGPGYLLRALAAAKGDGLAQWLADRVSAARAGKRSGLGSARLSWLDLVWFDPTVQPESPIGLPRHALFGNLGIYITRSDWSDSATWFFFKAGPPQGHLAAERGVLAGSHIHPDTGTFMLWADGGWVVVDDGYVMKKRTENHNVLLVNGTGQLGEGQTWFVKAASMPRREAPRISLTTTGAGRHTLEAELAPAYPEGVGLLGWKRRVDIIGGDAFEIRDDVVLRGTGTIESLIHTRDRALRRRGDVVCLADHSDFALVPSVGWDSVTATEYVVDPKERHKVNGFYEGGVVRLTRAVHTPGKEAHLSYAIVRWPECSPLGGKEKARD